MESKLDPYASSTQDLGGEPEFDLTPRNAYGQNTYTKPLVQRDKRTSLTFKQVYVGLTLTAMVTGSVAMGGGFYNARECQAYKKDAAKKYADALKIFFYLFFSMFVLWILFSSYLLVRWRWAWMTVTFAPPRLYGEDVEDFEPGILGRSGTRIAVDATRNADRTYYEVEKAYDDLTFTRTG